MHWLWRSSSAGQRFTHVPQAPSRPNRLAIVKWYPGRLSSVRRFSSSAACASLLRCDCSRIHGCVKSRPCDHGTYSCGIQFFATARWRSRFTATTGSSSNSRSAAMLAPLRLINGPGRWPTWSRGRQEREDDVVATEPERVGQRRRYGSPAGRAGHDVELDVGILLVKVARRRDHLVPHCQGGEYGLDRA